MVEFRRVNDVHRATKLHAGVCAVLAATVEVLQAFGNNPQGIRFDDEASGSGFALQPGGEVGWLTQWDAPGVLVAIDSAVGSNRFVLLRVDDFLRWICA